MEYIYMICEEPYSNKVKIGKTTNLKKRLASLQTGNPNKLFIKFSFASLTCEDVEKKLHDKLKEKRLAGEWFKMTKLQLDKLIKEYSNFSDDNITKLADQVEQLKAELDKKDKENKRLNNELKKLKLELKGLKKTPKELKREIKDPTSRYMILSPLYILNDSMDPNLVGKAIKIFTTSLIFIDCNYVRSKAEGQKKDLYTVNVTEELKLLCEAFSYLKKIEVLSFVPFWVFKGKVYMYVTDKTENQSVTKISKFIDNSTYIAVSAVRNKKSLSLEYHKGSYIQILDFRQNRKKLLAEIENGSN